MDADRQVEKEKLTIEQLRALAEKLRAHETWPELLQPPKKPELFPKPKPVNKYI